MNKHLIILIVLVIFNGSVKSGSFVFAGDLGEENWVAHPRGYVGSGGRLTLSVCINPASVNSSQLVQPVKNVVETWNQLNPTSGNLKLFGDNNIPGNFDYDWESVALHEVGHCIGLAHPNIANQSGVSGNDQNYTATNKGVDGVFDFNDGNDNIIGSADDLRDDDQNLHWFNKGVNNPFVLSPPFDSSNYSVVLADLPNGDNFSANGDRDVGANLGFNNTEAVMQQTTFNDEAQRTLGVDDVATIRFGMSGLDETAGSADDYTFRLEYGGIASNCDINITHNNSSTFGVCNLDGFFISSTHLRIDNANITIGDNSVDWFFNQEQNDLIFKNGVEY